MLCKVFSLLVVLDNLSLHDRSASTSPERGSCNLAIISFTPHFVPWRVHECLLKASRSRHSWGVLTLRACMLLFKAGAFLVPCCHISTKNAISDHHFIAHLDTVKLACTAPKDKDGCWVCPSLCYHNLHFYPFIWHLWP